MGTLLPLTCGGVSRACRLVWTKLVRAVLLVFVWSIFASRLAMECGHLFGLYDCLKGHWLIPNLRPMRDVFTYKNTQLDA